MKMKKVKIGEIGQIVTGNTPPRKNEDYFGSAYPWIKPTDIEIDYRFVEEPEEYYSNLAFKKYKNALLPPGATCVVTIGTVGQKLCLTKERSFTNQSINAIIPNQDYYDNDFVFYLMKFSLPKVSKANPGTASGRHHVSKSNFSNIEVEVPPKSKQQKIAFILAAFDDLLENNTRRIAILEEMARLIYREWFECFRYPGHENDRLVDLGAELGEVPEGWGTAKIDELVSSQYGYTESASEDKVGPKFIRGTDINKTSYINWPDVPYCPINDKDYEKFKVNIGDILVIRMADPGKLCIIEEEKEAVFASYLIRLIINDERITPYYLFYLMSDYEYQGFITGASTGTTRKSASAKVVKDYKIIIPPIELQYRFVDKISTLRKQLNVLLNQNNKLKETRDLLLPKLISGKVVV